MALRASIQHADFSNVELGELSPEEAWRCFKSIDWSEQLGIISEAFLLRKLQFCPPGLYLYQPSDEYLACYIAPEKSYVLNFGLTVGKSFFGKQKTKEFALARVDEDEVGAWMDRFDTYSSQQLIDALTSEAIVKEGIIGRAARQ